VIRKVLIANRGEIAVRVIRACRERGIGSVAVFSDADRASVHVRLADEAVRLGPAPAAESYLKMDEIIKAVVKTGADAVHPGYGFLAENAEFASRVVDAGLTWIGPPPEAIAALGDKLAARKRITAAGVPVVPGEKEPLGSSDEAAKRAGAIGYPVLLKAAAGGGGKGMRVVADEKEMALSFRAAVSESTSAFGDGRVYLEKYLDRPRHIEFQVFADTQGNVVHLGERECSIQRRHQKVIEESPSPVMTPDLRSRMGDAAVAAARASGYVGAGTIEFLVDPSGVFYFLEVNARLQVEHPVTEMVTGTDLVTAQLDVASGLPLRWSPDELAIRGAAIECRIYAEDPASGFLPSTGRLTRYHRPAGPGVRVDDGVVEGDEVSVYYDPMLAKVVTWGRDRYCAIARMRRALFEYHVAGVATTIPFHRAILEHPAFLSGDLHTGFIDQHKDDLSRSLDPEGTEGDVIAIAAALAAHEASESTACTSSAAPESKWARSGRLSTLRGKVST
jgi:acetyl-CoA carboxylase biotin carboxylase subunit